MKTKKVSKMRHKIALASIDIFLSRGFAIATMDYIAKELNMSKKTLYKYFKSKDHLIFYSINLILRTIERRLYNIHNNEDFDELEKFQHTVEFIVENLYKINPQYFTDLAVKYKYLWLYVDEFRRKRFIPILYKTLIRMQKKGMIKENLDINFILLVFYTILTKTVGPEQIVKNNIDYRTLGIQIYELFFNGILKDKRSDYEKDFFNDDIFSIFMF